ncbi:MAG: hypothetical protein WD872_09440 [Pirellulaceae bacterium]
MFRRLLALALLTGSLAAVTGCGEPAAAPAPAPVPAPTVAPGDASTSTDG